MVEPEQSADAVESDRGEHAARAEDGLAYRVAIKREQVKEILRQLLPRQLLAIEKIAGKHQDDVALGGALAGLRPNIGAAVRTRGTTDRLPEGRNWHARRTSGAAPMRFSVACSSPAAGGGDELQP